MKLLQFVSAQQVIDKQNICVGLVHNSEVVELLNGEGGIYGIAVEAIDSRRKLVDVVESKRSGVLLDYRLLESENRLLPPIAHPDPAHLMVSGTGLTHLGSAETRAAMHAKLRSEENLTDSMRMFLLGLEGGKPAAGGVGVQPEWFYKGDGNSIVAPGAAVTSPHFALDMGDEAEIVGIYVIGKDAVPYRLGFALGNEFSDHKTEKINYLYLAHSKLRCCALGPELLVGDLPQHVEGRSRVVRNNEVIWEKPFLSGENNMTHSIYNLEHHHFKYSSFLRPGDVHVHFYGASTLSFSDGVEACAGDIFEVECEIFGRPLRNSLKLGAPDASSDSAVVAL